MLNRFLIFLFLASLSAKAQDTITPVPKVKWYKGRLVKTIAVPALLTGYGISVRRDNGIYSSFEAQRDIQKKFSGFNTEIDDWLIYVPYAELAALNLFKIRCRNDFINTGLLILKSELLMAAIVFPLKEITHQLRPNGADYRSFPSGHTASAFVAASIVHKEFKHRSVWPGIGAYAVAVSVGAFRMLNNSHWQSDVFAGAGLGMLAVHLVYLTHRHRWGRKEICLVPGYSNKTKTVGLVWSF